MCTKNFTYTKKFYVHEIAAVDLSKICFLKNAKKTCKPNNRDLNHNWNNFIYARFVLRTPHAIVKYTQFWLFWPHFTQKVHFWSKTEQMKIAIDFSRLELVETPSFIWIRQFWIFDPNLYCIIKGISCLKEKIQTPPSHWAHSN